MNSWLFMFRWTGEAMVPLKGFAQRCNEAFSVDGTYRLEAREERSLRTHNHFFAAVNDAWLNLPEDLVERFPTPEHLRKWCLIKAGFREERSIAAGSAQEAERIAAFVRPMDEYAVIVVRDAVVTVYTAKSQSYKAMNKQEFSEAKRAVLDQCGELVGVDSTMFEERA